ncbi:MAG: TonB-dependent receptor, partial [Bacteroidota bacterium]
HFSCHKWLPREIELIQTLDPSLPTTIPLFGQSPYVLNGELAYIDKEDLGLQISASFNVFGPRLFAVGGGAPDIYEQPRPSLNFSIAKDIGKYLSVRFRANNLLNPEYKFTQDFKGETYFFQNNRVGRTFSLGLSFNLN